MPRRKSPRSVASKLQLQYGRFGAEVMYKNKYGEPLHQDDPRFWEEWQRHVAESLRKVYHEATKGVEEVGTMANMWTHRCEHRHGMLTDYDYAIHIQCPFCKVAAPGYVIDPANGQAVPMEELQIAAAAAAEEAKVAKKEAVVTAWAAENLQMSADEAAAAAQEAKDKAADVAKAKEKAAKEAQSKAGVTK